MKRQVLSTTILLTSLLFSSHAQAGGLTIESYRNGNGRAPTTFQLAGGTQVKGRLGVSAFALINSNWAEAYAGPTVTLVKPDKDRPGDLMIKVGTSLGISQGSDGLRSGSSLVIAKDSHLLVGIYEGTLDGASPSEHFWIVRYAYKLDDGSSVGVMARRYVGVGLRIDVPIGKKAGAWIMPAYDPEFKKAGMLIAFTHAI